MRQYSDFSPFFPSNEIKAGISLKPFPYFPPEDRKRLAISLKLDPKQLVIPLQVHSDNVRICTKPKVKKNTDGVVTNKQDLVLSIQVADCIPIFLVDPVEKVFGIIHAGWRGVVCGIIQRSVYATIQIGSDPKNLNVLLGPSIRQCCFEVGHDVARQFDSSYITRGINGRSMVDLQSIIIYQLEKLGVKNKKIVDLKECTCCQEKRYHSFRRDGKDAGRMIAILGWN